MSKTDEQKTHHHISAIEEDLKQKIDRMQTILDSPADGTAATAKESKLAVRLKALIRIAATHAQSIETGKILMPWRADLENADDVVWCKEVTEAIRTRKGRPAHPDTDMEEIIGNAFQ